MKKNTLGIVCTGGGALGAYQVGVLKYVFEDHIKTDFSPFKIFSGISSGSINTSFLASYSKTIKQDYHLLEKAWMDFHVPNYQLGAGSIVGNVIKNILKREWSLLDPVPMRKTLEKVVIAKRLEEAFKEKFTLGVSCVATNVHNGFPIWFQDGPSAFDWERNHAIAMKTDYDIDHVIASCSIPFFFPIHKVEGVGHLDGGVNIDRPLSSALSMGANYLLVITNESDADGFIKKAEKTKTTNKNKAKTKRQPKEDSAFLTVSKLLLNVFLRDRVFTEIEQIGVLNRFFDQTIKKQRVDGRRPKEGNAIFAKNFKFKNYQPITMVKISPSRSTEEVFSDFCDDFPQYRNGKAELMFHREFTKRLIQLGYDDAKIQKKELKKLTSAVASDGRT